MIEKKGLINSLIVEYESSNTYNIASYNAEIMLNLAPLMNRDQIIRVVDAALSNDQITFSWGARSSLNKFLSLYSNKIPKEKREKLLSALRS